MWARCKQALIPKICRAAREVGVRYLAGGEDACRLHDFFLRYSLADGALDGVARIVERADLGREGTRDQGAGLAAMVAGPGDVFRSDGARVSPALPLFYAGCRRRALHGVTPGRS